ncbi:electron transfer flavoprotein subunit alpha/FixB family protein [Capnocytophaga canimorsus]|uniref:electron transfer flavoprotein subunit alpha/FixB family protein n=1 Tax=Capnocytophaga canimorsus TaxID=28188 RepID=UPI00385D7854
MSILIYLDTENGRLKKSAFEVASYAKALATTLNQKVTAIAFNINDVTSLQKYGVDKVLLVNDQKLANFTAKPYALTLQQAAEKEQSSVVILSSSNQAKYLAPILAVKLQAGLLSNVISLPESAENFDVKRSVFSNKGYAWTRINTPKKIITLAANAFPVEENPATTLQTEHFYPALSEGDFNIIVKSTERSEGRVSIADASIVVSGGRGLKGPEHWKMIEELAEVLGGATACSKPVSDLGWRPHSEHVGQTGKPVAANLYIAIGISGAIQHLAGVEASKIKLVINNDENAPFFKSADYGVVGDAFEIVPKLIEKIKNLKQR